jgi:HAAS domain-containing protein
MGIESEQRVFDYLSRVGDLAHATSMTAAQRARLVADLRAHIDRARAAEGETGTTSDVGRILDRLGKPEEVVAASLSGASVPGPRTPPTAGPAGWRQAPPAAHATRGASPPHLAGMDELSPRESDPDWWRTDTVGPFGEGAGATPTGAVPGFVGGIELPEMLRPPGAQSPGPPAPGDTKPLPVAADAAVPAPAAPGGGGGRFLRALRRGGGAAGVPRAGGFVELAAVVLLVAGGVLGSLPPLALGWLATYWSPRLGRVEAKRATLFVPGLTAAGWLVWLWGRTTGHWGPPLGHGHGVLRQALVDTWPVALRVAAFATALYVLWRARRRV